MSFFSSTTESSKKIEQSERIARISEKLNMINLANSTTKSKKVCGLCNHASTQRIRSLDSSQKWPSTPNH